MLLGYPISGSCSSNCSRSGLKLELSTVELRLIFKSDWAKAMPGPSEKLYMMRKRKGSIVS